MARLYFKEYGPEVLENGYEIIPIAERKKYPVFDTWRSLKRITEKVYRDWLKNGSKREDGSIISHERSGIGIRTKYTPFLDVDSQYPNFNDVVLAKLDASFGRGPIRVGRAPKFGMVYRTEKPFTKIQTNAYLDPGGNKCQVEFLGDGQQFAAYGIHPDTGKPYRWKDKGQNPKMLSIDDLIVITEQDARNFIDGMEAWFKEQGWKLDTRTITTGTAATRPQGDEVWSGWNASKCDLTFEQFEQYMDELPNSDSVDYESEFGDSLTYRNVIFAACHQTDGSNEGKAVALRWAMKDNNKHEKEEGRFDKAWGSALRKEGEPAITFRYIIRIVNALRAEAKAQLCNNHLESLAAVDNTEALKNLIETITKTDFDKLDTARIVTALRDAYKRIVGGILPVAEARKMIKPQPTEEEKNWIKPWVFIRNLDQLYNTKTGEYIEKTAFDGAFTREIGGYPASVYALQEAKVKTYWMAMYKPDDEAEFLHDGRSCINTYSDRLMPETPRRLSKGDKRALRLFHRHLETILPDARERALMLSWLAYVVQTRLRPNWAIVLQGIEGDGKSFIGELMTTILGLNNVSKLDPYQFDAPHTGWAVGQLFAFIEEIRLVGHSKFDILNKLKPYISNQYVNVHPKGKPNYTAYNTTAYFAATNFEDALPIDDNDRRWMILMSAWDDVDNLRKFLADNPDYFDKLFAAIKNHAGAFRKYFMEYEQHADFQPKGRAPLTAARERMINASKSDAQMVAEELVEDNNHPRIGPSLIVSSSLSAELKLRDQHTTPRSLGNMISKMKYKKCRHRIRLDPEQQSKDSIWVKRLSKFDANSEIETKRRVLAFLRNRQRELAESNEV